MTAPLLTSIDDQFASIKAANDDLAILRNTLAHRVKATILLVLVQFFNEYPAVTGIQWKQYAPHFNDGDPCVFSVHGMYVRSIYNDEPDEYADEWYYGAAFPDDLKNILKQIERFLDQNDESLEIAFGSHAEVTATPDGVSVDEDVYHD